LISKTALIITGGLHPPWNIGEVVIARNFALILKKLYNGNIEIISTIDKERENLLCQDSSYSDLLGVTTYINEYPLHNLSSWIKYDSKKVDLHLLHILPPIIGYFAPIRDNRPFLYQFSYNSFDRPVLRWYISPFSAILNRFTVFTTCIKKYKQLSFFFRRNYYYVPAPLYFPMGQYWSTKSKKRGGPLKVVYIGHATYKRFPYIEIFKALADLRKDGYDIAFSAYFSRIIGRYFNYISFIKQVNTALMSFKLDDMVKIYAYDLTEEEKYEVLKESDVFLYLALSNVAIDPPLTILEALAAGCCVISTPVQSIPFILKHAGGIVLPFRDLAIKLSEALKMLIEEDSTSFRVRSESAIKYIRLFHHYEVVSKYLEKVINQ